MSHNASRGEHVTAEGARTGSGRGSIRPFRMRRTGPVALVILGIGVLAAACGGGSPPGVASIGSTTSTTVAVPSGGGSTSQGGGSGGASNATSGGVGMGGLTVAFSACIRAHGIAGFPDPDSQGNVQFNPSGALNPTSSQFQAAQQACASTLPTGSSGKGPSPAERAKMLAAALKFSECMRNHGITDYPDPRVQGDGISMSLKAQGGASNLNPSSPKFQAAQKACSSVLGKGPGIVQTSGGGAKS